MTSFRRGEVFSCLAVEEHRASRSALEQYFAWRLTAAEWDEVKRATGIRDGVASDVADFEAARTAVLGLPRYRDRVAREVANVRRVLQPDGTNPALNGILALGTLDVVLRGQRSPLPSQWTEKQFEGLGKLAAASVAAFDIEQRLRMPEGSCLPAIVGTERNHEALHHLLKGADLDFSKWARELLVGTDRRKTRLLQDLQLTSAIARIGETAERAAETAESLWSTRADVYEREYAPTVGRSFSDAQLPWRALRQGYREARKRVIARLPELDEWLPPP